MIRHELSRAFHSKEWLTSFLLGMVIVLLHFFITVPQAAGELSFGAAHQMIPHSVFSKWIGLDGSMFASALYFISVPILAVLPFGGSYYQDRKSGYNRQMMLRVGRGRYLAGKYIASFLAAGSAVVLPLLIGLIMTASVLPSIKPVLTAGYFPLGMGRLFLVRLFHSDPYLYVLIYLLIIFAFSGAFAGIALAVAPFAQNSFMVWIAPFLLVEAAGVLVSFFGFRMYAPEAFLNPGQPTAGITWLTMGICFLVSFLPAFCLYWWKGMKDDIL